VIQDFRPVGDTILHKNPLEDRITKADAEVSPPDAAAMAWARADADPPPEAKASALALAVADDCRSRAPVKSRMKRRSKTWIYVFKLILYQLTSGVQGDDQISPKATDAKAAIATATIVSFIIFLLHRRCIIQ